LPDFVRTVEPQRWNGSRAAKFGRGKGGARRRCGSDGGPPPAGAPGHQ